jgi:hypothetical protein
MTLRDADLYAAGFTRLLLIHDTTTDPPRVGFRADKDGWQVVGCSIPGDESVSSGYKTNFPESMADIIAPRRSPITGGDGSRDWSHTERKVMGSFAGTRQDIAFFRLAELPHITERWRLGTTRGPDGSMPYERSDEETMRDWQEKQVKPNKYADAAGNSVGTAKEWVDSWNEGLEAKPGNAEQSSENRTPDEGRPLTDRPADPLFMLSQSTPAAPRVKVGDRVLAERGTLLGEATVAEITKGGNVRVFEEPGEYGFWVRPSAVVEVLP